MDRVFSTDIPFLAEAVSVRHRAGIAKYLYRNETFGKCMVQWGLGDGNSVYSFNIGSHNFLSYAKSHGLKVVSDIFIHPLSERIVRDHCYPCSAGLDEYAGDGQSIRLQMLCRTCELSDVLLCPSEWVAEGVRESFPHHTGKIRVCPYGSSISYDGRINEPIRGRIFWAGREWLRKGLNYLAAAADQLKKSYPDMEFRAAGIVDRRVTRMSRFRNIRFLGKLTRAQMQDEFLLADAFALPTLSEGMASVAVEAISAGCPVITRRLAGLAISDSLNGLLVPPGDAEALAAAIERIYCDRTLRNRLAENTRVLACTYTCDAWRARLVEVFQDL